MKKEDKQQIEKIVNEAFSRGYAKGKYVGREWCALLVEQLGAEGYGTLAIASAIRERNQIGGNETLQEM